LTEVALLLPVLLLVLLAIVKFGIMYNNYIALTDSVRSGARDLALGRGSSDPCGAAITETIQSAGNLNLTAAQVTPVLVLPDQCGPTGSSGYIPNSSVLIQPDKATVTATYPCDLSFLGYNFYPGCTMTASASEAIE
jgi:hypothetical protein